MGGRHGWGLYLDPENHSLAAWYEKNGFKATIAKKPENVVTQPEATHSEKPVAMYAPLKQLLPEIPGLP